MTNALKGKDFKNIIEDNAFYCPYCYKALSPMEEDKLFCSNEMCLSEQEYDKFGNPIKEE